MQLYVLKFLHDFIARQYVQEYFVLYTTQNLSRKSMKMYDE
jgi:hypothetical protein